MGSAATKFAWVSGPSASACCLVCCLVKKFAEPFFSVRPHKIATDQPKMSRTHFEKDGLIMDANVWTYLCVR